MFQPRQPRYRGSRVRCVRFGGIEVTRGVTLIRLLLSAGLNRRATQDALRFELRDARVGIAQVFAQDFRVMLA
jgi:hypothetical protein